MSLFWRRCAGFLRQAEGSVAIIFAFASLVLILVVGLVVDYGQVSLAQTRLQESADSAVLSAVSSQQDSSATRAHQAATLQASALASFNTLTAQNELSISSASASVSPAPQALAVTLNYSAAVPAVFGQMVGLHTYSVGGTSTATASAPNFIDIYLLVDISGSMGIGASAADQTLMNNTPGMNQPSGGCVFACHQEPDWGTDAVAHQAGATLRIDVVKQGLQQIIAAAEASSVVNGQTIRLAIITYGTNVQTNVAITSNYLALTNAATDLQLASYDAGTSTYDALQYVGSQISAIGDGGSADKPLVYVLLATDGTSDSNDNIQTSHAPWYVYSPNFYPLYSSVPVGSPFPHSVPDLANHPTVELEGLDPAWCNPLKSMGATVMTLEMPYVIPPAAEFADMTNAFQYIQNTLLPIIPAQMTACASQPSYHISASLPSDILAAMNTLFQQTQAGVPRLSK